MPKVTEAHMEARRQQILDAAFKCFSENGFHQTTMQHICRAANLSPGAVYRYFSSKEEIIESSCVASQQQTSDLFESARQKGETLQVVNEIVGVFFGMLDQPNSETPLRLSIQLWGEALRNQNVKDMLETGRKEVHEQLTRVVAQAQAKGEINRDLDPAYIARLMLATYDGLVLQKGLDADVDVWKFTKVLMAMFGGDFWKGKAS